MKVQNLKHIIPALAGAALLSGMLASCSSGKHNVKPENTPTDVVVESRHLTKAQKKLVEEAESWLGTPYCYAKADKRYGTDCSGMVMQVYKESYGYDLPRNSARQAEFCIRLAKEDVDVGDLVFFATGKDPKKASHVGIMLNQEKFIHASSSKGVVISTMTNPYFRRTFLMYGRVPELCSSR